MESRKITIVNQSTQSKHVLNSTAETLGQLKQELISQNIPHSGMTFIEALSKTELYNDDSLLPHDIPFRGATTNDLVFMLTMPNKKISSGMDRSELYQFIAQNNIADDVKKEFGMNYTNCRTSDLKEFVSKFIHNQETETPANETENICDMLKALRDAFFALLDELEDYDLSFDLDSIRNMAVPKKKDTTVYSAGMNSDDIDDIINSL